jgi:PhnB protein
MPVKPIPEGYHTLSTYLAVDNAAEAIEFYKRAFGAEELFRAPDPTGKKVWHANLRIGDSCFFVNDVAPEMGGKPSVCSLWIYAPNVDAAFERATKAGAKATMPPQDMFWGDRMGSVVDKWGITWNLATHIKDPTPEEMKKAQDAFVAEMAKQKK